MDRLRKTLILACGDRRSGGGAFHLRAARRALLRQRRRDLPALAEGGVARLPGEDRQRGAAPDLRMQLVDRPEIADFVLADDFGAAAGSACRSPVPVKTIKVDSETRAPDVTVSLAPGDTVPDYRVYVHSVRYSHQDVAALLAALWKAQQALKLAERG